MNSTSEPILHLAVCMQYSRNVSLRQNKFTTLEEDAFSDDATLLLGVVRPILDGDLFANLEGA